MPYSTTAGHAGQGKKEKIDALNQAAWDIRVTDSNQSFFLSQQAVDLATDIHYQQGLAEGLRTLGFCHIRRANYQQALVILQEALQLFIQLHHLAGQSDIYEYFGIIQRSLGEYAASLNFLFKSLDLRQSIPYREGESLAYYHMGVTYRYLGDYNNALKYFLFGLSIAREIGALMPKAYLLNNIGIVYFETGDYREALQYYHQGLSIWQIIGDQWGQAGCLDNIGTIYYRLGDYGQALQFSFQGLQLSKTIGDQKGQGNTLFNLGKTYLKLSDNTNSLDYCNQSLRIRAGIGDKKGQAEVLLFLADGYEEAAHGLPFLHQALRLGEAVQAKDLMYKIHLALSKALKKEGNYQEAFFHLEQYNILLKEVNNEEVSQQIHHLQISHRVQQVKNEAEKADRLKTRFFTNISHELRTPLTLILGPLEKKLAGLKGDHPDFKDLHLMQSNARRLLQLINQLLDFSKLEAGSMTFHPVVGDIQKQIKFITFSFSSLAESKNIEVLFRSAYGRILARFDPDVLDKILSNLLSNAFKFTPENGQVSVSLTLAGEADSLEANPVLTIRVEDTGIGIATDQLPYIFDRFFQVDTLQEWGVGTGIGLALVKELVELHQGHIQVKSEIGVGTQFTVRLPLTDCHAEVSSPAERGDEPLHINHPKPMRDGKLPATYQSIQKKSLPLLLLVEDNMEVREFLRESFQEGFRVLEASNGVEGLDLGREHIPDLIITDRMMPHMDGIELCLQLKTDERTSHIPVIMLTAKASEESKLAGLETGADDYLAKPFSLRELKVRVNNLLKQRKQLRQRFSRQMQLQPRDIAITSADETFLIKALSIIEKHLSDDAFTVEILAEKIALSRVQLHRKLKALTDQSANEFIRTIRLKRAASLLEQGYGNVSEVMYQVGFTNVSYFAGIFRKMYGVNPSEYPASLLGRT
ncbi:tetratricopeptide repeat protein [Rhodocytophaga rosea]|uniref:histidine kinase n=1 Tax=Rhodocytophaga rosea TaxID=2704465 RepID=A0A6C0GWX2_9BACT|nr:tetratricopeptide repeat protein [Rhodocytophaga rosea]QHT71800.1 tetratricopeptide repeat protein [Rhodocytophaga rosea]